MRSFTIILTATNVVTFIIYFDNFVDHVYFFTSRESCFCFITEYFLLLFRFCFLLLSFDNQDSVNNALRYDCIDIVMALYCNVMLLFCRRVNCMRFMYKS